VVRGAGSGWCDARDHEPLPLHAPQRVFEGDAEAREPGNDELRHRGIEQRDAPLGRERCSFAGVTRTGLLDRGRDRAREVRDRAGKKLWP
jgi:hypothetical protein